jgi:hypothetical protein
MINKTDRVIAGFFRLSDIDQAEVIKQINLYRKETASDQKSMQALYESRAGIDLGPINQGGVAPAAASKLL